jgi:F0F1-type ATP synthase epsilon subunit
MSRQRIRVELTTPRGRVFSGVASSIELRTAGGLIAITPFEKSYLSMLHTTEIRLRIGSEFRAFVLENANASLSDGLLTVLAEKIRSAQTPVPNAAGES